VDVAGDAAKRERTPAGVVARTRSGREERRRHFEEEESRERINPIRKIRGTVDR
jgi:hypothetical protein